MKCGPQSAFCRFVAWIVIAAMNLSFYAPMIQAQNPDSPPLDPSSASIRPDSEEQAGSISGESTDPDRTLGVEEMNGIVSQLPVPELGRAMDEEILEPFELASAHSVSTTITPALIALPAQLSADAQSLFDTATSLEEQDRRVDAVLKYMEIMDEYPNSEVAGRRITVWTRCPKWRVTSKSSIWSCSIWVRAFRIGKSAPPPNRNM